MFVAALPVVLAWLLLTGPAATQEQPRLAPIVIELSQKAGPPMAWKGAIVLRPAEGEPVRLPVSSTKTVTVELPPGSTWEVSADLPGFWAPRKALAAGPPGQETRLVLDLWPMGTVSGVLRLKEKVPLPRQLLVKTLAAPAFARRLPAPKGALDCPVDEKGAWNCSLPAATFDLVVSAQGFIPQYRWAVEIPAGKVRSLGTLTLERGASVAGWAAVEGGAISPDCEVLLAPLGSGGADSQEALDIERRTVQAKVRKDGFFQMPGLAPGVYVIEVRQPGHAPARLAPVRVLSQAETFLEQPLVLTRLLDLAFELSPALDWLGRPWRVQLIRQEEGSGKPNPVIFDGPAAQDGQLVVPGQSPGRFGVRILDSVGNRLAERDVAVEGPSLSPERIEIDLISLEGTVRLGQQPLPADLWFGGRSGAVSIKLESDEDGRFHGVLPRDGDWRIDIQAAEPRLRTRTRTEVRANRSGKAAVEIVLPDTRVFGTVVDERGNLVPQADVIILSERVEVFEQADAAGTFEVRGLPEGTNWLAAAKGSRHSARTFLSLAEGRSAGPIELRLQPTRELSGTVRSPAGPVAGARVEVLAALPPEGGGTARTGLDGRFQVDLPERTQRVVAVVSAPGYALRAFEAGVGAPLSLNVSEEAGELVIRLLEDPDDVLRRDLAIALFQNGLPIPANVYGQWASDQGQPRGGASLRIPNVAPGEYRICLVPLRLPMEGDPAAAGAECRSGSLVRGGSLTLEIGPP